MTRKKSKPAAAPAELAEPAAAQTGRYAYDGLDRTIHEKARLGILTSLAAHPGGLWFNDLKSVCSLSDGNLSRHLQTLEEAGLVEVRSAPRAGARKRSAGSPSWAGSGCWSISPSWSAWWPMRPGPPRPRRASRPPAWSDRFPAGPRARASGFLFPPSLCNTK